MADIYNLNEKVKIPENIRELTDTFERIEQAAPKAAKPTKRHKGKGSQDSKKHPGSNGLDRPIPRKKDRPTKFCDHCKKHGGASTI